MLLLAASVNAVGCFVNFVFAPADFNLSKTSFEMILAVEPLSITQVIGKLRIDMVQVNSLDNMYLGIYDSSFNCSCGHRDVGDFPVVFGILSRSVLYVRSGDT